MLVSVTFLLAQLSIPRREQLSPEPTSSTVAVCSSGEFLNLLCELFTCCMMLPIAANGNEFPRQSIGQPS
jgi:hypothetical protein